MKLRLRALSQDADTVPTWHELPQSLNLAWVTFDGILSYTTPQQYAAAVRARKPQMQVKRLEQKP